MLSNIPICVLNHAATALVLINQNQEIPANNLLEQWLSAEWKLWRQGTWIKDIKVKIYWTSCYNKHHPQCSHTCSLHFLWMLPWPWPVRIKNTCTGWNKAMIGYLHSPEQDQHSMRKCLKIVVPVDLRVIIQPDFTEHLSRHIYTINDTCQHTYLIIYTWVMTNVNTHTQG